MIEVPGFEVLEQVGEGGMAVVWKAHQVSLDRTVAIKVLKKQFTTDPEDIRAFIDEAKSAAKIKHPHIIQVHDVAEHDGLYYFVMEYINGETIGQILDREGPFPQKRALSIALRVAEALEAAWTQSHVVHRDIKPHNIMIDDDGTVKLADLGLAKIVDSAHLSSQLHAGVIEGTPNYISPEQARCSLHTDFRTDMYSLGATLYHMLTGHMPFAGRPPSSALHAHIEERLPNPKDLAPSLTVGAVQLLTRLMMKNPEDRYPDWNAAVDAIKKTASGRLLLGAAAGNAASTIDSARAVPDTPKKTGTQAPEHGPIFHVASWAAIGMVWLLLAYVLLRPPPSPPQEKRALGTPRTDQAAPSRSVSPSRRPPSHQPRTGSSVAIPIELDTPPVPEVEEPEAPSLDLLLTTVTDHVLARDFGTAVALIDREMRHPHPAENHRYMEGVRDAIYRASNLDAAVEAAFRAGKDKKTVIRHNGVDRNVIIQKVRDGKIDTLVVDGRGHTRPVSFRLSLLDSLELSRWLGESDSPSRALQKFVLHMEAGDLDGAAELAARCGPLADMLASAVQRKR